MLAGAKTILSAAPAQKRGAHATTPRGRDARGALLTAGGIARKRLLPAFTAFYL